MEQIVFLSSVSVTDRTMDGIEKKFHNIKQSGKNYFEAPYPL